MAGSMEQGRQDAHRQALNSLLARFTADRDALITSIKECQGQIAALVARLDSGDGPARPAADVAVVSADGAAAATDVAELRAAVAALREEQERAFAAVSADAAQAVDRADAALGAALGAVQQLNSGQPDDPTAPQADATALASAVALLQADVARLQTVVDASGVPPARTDDELRAGLESALDARLHESAGRWDAEVTGLKSAIAALEDELRAALTRAEAAAASGVGTDAVDARLRAALDTELAPLRAALEAQPQAADLEVLRTELAQVAAALDERVVTRLRDAAAGWESELAALRARVEDAASPAPVAALGATVEELRAAVARAEAAAASGLGTDAVDARLRIALDTELAPLRAALEARPWAADLETLRGELGNAKIAERIDAGIRNATRGGDAALAALRSQVERLGAGTADAGRLDALRTDLARVETLVERRVAELKSASERTLATLRDDVTRIAAESKSTTRPEALHATVEQLRAELARSDTKIGERIDAGIQNATRAGDAALAALRSQVERLATASQGRPDATELRALVARLEASVEERLAAAAARSEAESASLREPTQALAAGLGELRAEVTALTTGAGERTAAIEQLRATIGRVEGKVSERIDAGVRNAARGFDAALSALRAQVERLGTSEVAAEVERLGGDLARLEGTVEARLSEAAATMEPRLAALAAQLDAIQANGAAETRVVTETLRSEVSRMESTMGNYLDTMRTSAEADLAELRARVEEVAAGGARVDELEAAMRGLRDEVARSQENLAERLDVRVGTLLRAWENEARRLRDAIEEAAATRADEAVSAAGVAALGGLVDELRADVGRLHGTVREDVEERLAAVTTAWRADGRTLQERLERVHADLAGATAAAVGALPQLRASIDQVRADVSRVERTLEERVTAGVRAADERWGTEARSLRDAVAGVRQANEALVARALGEVRTSVEGLRGDFGRMEAGLDRRVDARLRDATGHWDGEAVLLRTRIEQIADRLAARERAEAESTRPLRAAAAAVGAGLAAVRAVAGSLPGVRLAAAVASGAGRIFWR